MGDVGAHRRVGTLAAMVVLVALVASSAAVLGQSPSPVASPAATGDLLDLCSAEGPDPCPLPAGRYAPARSVIPMVFELDEGWSGTRYYADAFGIVRPGEPIDLTMRMSMRG